MISLGLDASSTTVGYAYTDDTKEVLSCGFIDISKLETIREKVQFVLSTIQSHAMFETASQIVLEAAMSGFSFGNTRQQVVILLARFNAVLEYVLTEKTQKKVLLVNVLTARKFSFGKARVTGMKPKVFVESMIDVLYGTGKFNILTKRGSVDKRTQDVLDAIVLSLYRKNS